MSSDLDVNIVVTADDQASGTIAGVSDSVSSMQSSLAAGMDPIQDETSALLARRKEIMGGVRVGRLFANQFKQQHKLFFTSTRLIGQVGNAGLKLNSIFLNYNVLQERIANADDRVGDARRRLAEATAKFGANSKKAKDAQEDLTKAMKNQEKVAREVPGQYLAMGTAAFSIVGDIAMIAQTLGLLRFQMRGMGGLSGIMTKAFGGGGGGGVGGITPVGGGGFLTKGRLIRGGIAAAAGVTAAAALQGSPLSAGISERAPFLDPISEFLNTWVAGPMNTLFGLGKTPTPEEFRQAAKDREGTTGGGDTINIHGDIHVSGASAATLKGLMDDVKNRTKVQQRIGGHSS